MDSVSTKQVDQTYMHILFLFTLGTMVLKLVGPCTLRGKEHIKLMIESCRMPSLF